MRTVHPTASTVIEMDDIVRQHAGEGRAGELATLVDVEDLRGAEAGSASSSASKQNETSIVFDSRQPQRQYRPARPVHDHHEIEEAAAHRDIGDVSAPGLVRPLDRKTAQQIRENLVSRRRLRGARLRPERRNPACG